MDEPFGALDNQTRVLMQELLLGIWEAERKTVMFVTHDIDEAIFIMPTVWPCSVPSRPHQDRAGGRPAAPAPLHDQDGPEFMDLKAPSDGRDPRRIAGRRSALNRLHRCQP